MTKLIIANWKSLPKTLDEAVQVARAIGAVPASDAVELVVCPGDAYRDAVAPLVKEVATLGAQDVAARDEDAQALAAQGVRYVIIGHSYRRWQLGEDEATTNAKLKTVLRNGLIPIVCLGERTREGAWQDELEAQTVETFKGLTPGQVSQCRIAYEPVWAISTNPDAKPDTPASAVQSMTLLRQVLADHYDVSHPTFLYGGSITQDNVMDFLSRPEVSGVLVGGASVRPEEFTNIMMMAQKL